MVVLSALSKDWPSDTLEFGNISALRRTQELSKAAILGTRPAAFRGKTLSKKTF
jgi:hypothetical protein